MVIKRKASPGSSLVKSDRKGIGPSQRVMQEFDHKTPVKKHSLWKPKGLSLLGKKNRMKSFA